MRQEAADHEDLLAGTGYLLARVGAESRRWWGQMLGEYELTPHQYGVLMALADGAASQQRLSGAIGVDPRNAVPIIDALERRMLLARTADPVDRRRHALTLTPQGRAMVKRLRRAGEDLEDRFLESLGDAERSQLHATLRKLFDAVAGSSPN